MINFDVDYFLAKFEAIPEEEIITQKISSPLGRCALGHCAGGMMEGNTERGHLYALMKFKTPIINDGLDLRYQQETPKQRILAALRDIKAAQK